MSEWPDELHLSALHYAVQNDNVEMAQMLLLAGAEVNAIGSIRNTRKRVTSQALADSLYFHAALHMAAAYCVPKMVELLLLNGADVNLVDLEVSKRQAPSPHSRLAICINKRVIRHCI